MEEEEGRGRTELDGTRSEIRGVKRPPLRLRVPPVPRVTPSLSSAQLRIQTVRTGCGTTERLQSDPCGTPPHTHPRPRSWVRTENEGRSDGRGGGVDRNKRNVVFWGTTRVGRVVIGGSAR